MKTDDIATPKVIGSNVRKKRHERHWSLDELADASGVSKATLSQIESGRVNPTVATLWKIAQSLETELSLLIKGEGETFRTFSVTREGDLRPFGKAMTAALNGRGGGKPIFQQGRVNASRAAIEAFFREN